MHFILKHPYNNFQDCKLKMSQVLKMLLMRIIKFMTGLTTRAMRQRKKKKWATVPTRQRKSQPQRPNQRKMTTQITISQEGKSAQLLKSFLAKSKKFPK